MTVKQHIIHGRHLCSAMTVIHTRHAGCRGTLSAEQSPSVQAVSSTMPVCSKVQSHPPSVLTVLQRPYLVHCLGYFCGAQDLQYIQLESSCGARSQGLLLPEAVK